jgi:hypothetical protein
MVFALCAACFGGGVARAFPPAPYYTIYGDVRDENGLLIPAEGAAVVLYQNSKEIFWQDLISSGSKDYNYQMRIDMLRSSTTSYSSIALGIGTTYTLGGSVGGHVYSPIEVKNAPAVGGASDRKRLNLTLGIDSDGDGLPDAWEESQLYQAGYPYGNGWDLSLIDRDGDLDGDGVSNWQEYLAGTYAGDKASVLSLKIKEKLESSARLEFYAMYGKTYSIEVSENLKEWVAVDFTTTAPTAEVPGTPASSLVATNTGVTSVYAAASGATVYYRLLAR